MTEFVEFKIKLYEHSKVTHTLFLRQHRVREKDEGKPTDRTVFVSGVPPFLNKIALHKLFSSFGNVSAVHVHKAPSPMVPENETSKFFKTVAPIEGFSVAYIVFQSEDGLEAVLANTNPVVIPKNTMKNGFKKWAHEYNKAIPNSLDMQKEIDAFMKKFDKQDAKKQKEEKAATEMDDEGWITVTKQSRKAGFARKESVLKQIEKKGEKKRKKKELTNFYRFQIKESKMKNLVSLRQKFEEDKKRIATLKATRRFKPF